MSLCQYRDIFGKPFQGIHKYRLTIGNYSFAIVDIALTIMGAILISRFYNINYWWSLSFLFILGIILHKIFCVDTTLNLLLFGPSSERR